jgi:hypothetical protein
MSQHSVESSCRKPHSHDCQRVSVANEMRECARMLFRSVFLKLRHGIRGAGICEGMIKAVWSKMESWLNCRSSLSPVQTVNQKVKRLGHSFRKTIESTFLSGILNARVRGFRRGPQAIESILQIHCKLRKQISGLFGFLTFTTSSAKQFVFCTFYKRKNHPERCLILA